MPEYSPGSSGNLPVQTVNVVGVNVERLTFNGQPVVTFAMIDQVHQRVDGTAGRTYRDNRARFVANEDFFEVNQPDVLRRLGFTRPQGGTPASIVLLTQRGYLKLTKPMDDDRAWMVQGEMIDHYFATSRGTLLPDFTDPAAAARAFADQYEATQIAIRTKAEIGSRREATAMATASVAVRRANRLEIEMDKASTWASIKRMEKHYKPRTFEWYPLKTATVALSLKPIKAMDPNFGEVNTYPAEAWMRVYGLEIPHGVAA